MGQLLWPQWGRIDYVWTVINGGVILVRDIRNDLRERLAVINGMQADEESRYFDERMRIDNDHARALESFERERSVINQLLAIEERRGSLPTIPTSFKSPLPDFLITNIKMFGPMSKNELRAAVESAGYFEDDEANGRTFHTTLMNITKGGRLRQLPDDRYAMPDLEGLFSADGETKEGEMRTLM
jgi:hypothetical protein